jgi:hypothetical protein
LPEARDRAVSLTPRLACFERSRPAARVARASAASVRALAREMPALEAEPSPISRCLPARRYMNTQRLPPLSEIDRYKLPPSEWRPGALRVSTARAESLLILRVRADPGFMSYFLP